MPPKEGATKENKPASREDPLENESSYETVTEEEIEPPAPRARPLVAVKSAAAPKPPARAVEESDEESSAESLLTESEELGPVAKRVRREVDGSSDSRTGPARDKRERREEPRRGRSVTRASEPSRKTRPPEPDSPPGKGPGKGKFGKSKGKNCEICWRRIGPSESARDQHRYWNLTCLCWQQFQSGKHGSWDDTCVAAHAQKTRHEARAQLRLAARAHAVEEACKHASEVPVKKKEKKTKERKDKKVKKERRNRRTGPAPSRSPDPARKHKHHRKPPSSDSEDAGFFPRLKQTGPDTFKLIIGR